MHQLILVKIILHNALLVLDCLNTCKSTLHMYNTIPQQNIVFIHNWICYVAVFHLVLTDFETQNKYRVFNSMGQQVFFIQEGNQSILILNQNSQKELSLLMLQWINLWLCSESGCCWRYCCGPDRKFMMHITDNNNQVRRPVLCCKRHNRWLFGLFRDDAHTVFFCTTGSDAITATVWVRGTVLCRLLRLL